MSIFERYRSAGVPLLATCVVLALAPTAGAASYPAGGSTFATGAEGWQATEASCSIPLGTCSAAGSHDPGSGNPPGALRAETSVGLNLGGLFASSVTFVSPDFLVGESGPAVVHVDRQFSSTGLLTLAPQADYTVSLVDRGTGTSSEAIAESLGEADSIFAGKDGAAAVVAGRTYAIAIDADTGSTATGIGVLGEAAVRFDNVSLATAAAPGGGAGADVVRKHVFVKVRCPRRPQRTCWISAHGRIRMKVRVTYRRTLRVAKGRSRVIALRIKPRFQQRVLRRKRIVVVQRVRIGKRTRTFSRSRALIRR